MLTIVSMTNNIRNINPDSNELRSIDVFLLICLIFVFGALFELALTGMTDAKGTTWWRNKRKKDAEEKAAKTEDAVKENVRNLSLIVCLSVNLSVCLSVCYLAKYNFISGNMELHSVCIFSVVMENK